MNWKEINEQCPLAVLELFRQTIDEDAKAISKINLGWIEISYGARGYGNFPEDVLESQLLQLPEYFDALGIHVDAPYEDEMSHKEGKDAYSCHVTEQGFAKMYLLDDGELMDWQDAVIKLFHEKEIKYFPTRREALEAGVIKAFEIREEQLKQKEK